MLYIVYTEVIKGPMAFDRVYLRAYSHKHVFYYCSHAIP